MKLVKTITLHQFPTHVKLSDKRRAKKDKEGNITNPRAAGTPKFQKINFQYLYDGSAHGTTRQKMIKHMHHYINKQIRNVDTIDMDANKPLVIRGMLYAPINFGSVRTQNGNVIIKDPPEGYVPNWDMINFGTIWVKAFEDCISGDEMDSKGETIIRPRIIPDDHCGYVSGTGEMRVRFIEKFSQRKIVFNIYQDDLDEYF